MMAMGPSASQSPIRLTAQGCVNETPTWSPDGRRLYWASNCDGDFELYRADLHYSYDTQYSAEARLENVTNLTNNSSDDRFVRVSPDGRTLAYSNNAAGNWDLTLATSNGELMGALFNAASNEEAPTWSPDGSTLAYASDSDGDYEIYTVVIGRPGSSQKITNNSAQDRWPLWAQ